MRSNRICHGYGLAFEDGTGSLIKASLGCFYPTANPFWKDSEDVESRIKQNLIYVKPLLSKNHI